MKEYSEIKFKLTNIFKINYNLVLNQNNEINSLFWFKDLQKKLIINYRENLKILNTYLILT